MNILPVDGSGTQYLNGSKKSGEFLNMDQFLNVLLTQLEHQNPLQPMNDIEYISQVAQFSMLDGINRLNTEFMQTRAVDFIGKNVAGVLESADSGAEQVAQGKVRGFSLYGGEILLNLDDGSSLYLRNVREVSEETE